MKKLIIILIAFMFGINACSTVNVPEKIKDAFGLKFAKATGIKWEHEQNNRWEAEFDFNNTEMSAIFDKNGTWLETETEMEMENVPDAVKKSVKAKFGSYKVIEVSFVETPEHSGYEIELKNHNGEKMKVLFDNTGKGLKREKITSED